MKLTELFKINLSKATGELWVDEAKEMLRKLRAHGNPVPNFDHINAFDPKSGKKVKLPVLQLVSKDEPSFFVLADNSLRKIVAILDLGKRYLTSDKFNFAPYSLKKIYQTGVTPEYQGQKIGWALYKGLIVYSGINLIADEQSLGARKMWAALSQDPAVSVWALARTRSLNNPVDIKFYPTEPNNIPELVGKQGKRNIRLYNTVKRDFELIATKKSGPLDSAIKQFILNEYRQKKAEK